MVGRANVSGPAVMWAVRLHELDGVTDASVADFMSGLDGAYVICKETEAKRVHYQGWAISSLKDATIRVRLKKAFPSAVGNKGYSLKPAQDGEKYMRYCMKGTRDTPPTVVCRQGVQYTDAWVQNEWRQFWAHEKSEAYELKKAKRSVAEVVWDHFELYKGEVTARYVTWVILHAYNKYRKPYDIFAVRRLRNAIMSRYDPRWMERMAQWVDADVRDALGEEYNSGPDIPVDL